MVYNNPLFEPEAEMVYDNPLFESQADDDGADVCSEKSIGDSDEIRDLWKKWRVWLGTFDTAKAVPCAYDNAVQALRGAEVKTIFLVPCDDHSTSQSSIVESSSVQKNSLSKKSTGSGDLNRTGSCFVKSRVSKDVLHNGKNDAFSMGDKTLDATVQTYADVMWEMVRVWRKKMGLEKSLGSASKLDMQAFLQFLVTFRIGKDFKQNELCAILLLIVCLCECPMLLLLEQVFEAFDFVVMETIEFADDEDEELPQPMTLE